MGHKLILRLLIGNTCFSPVIKFGEGTYWAALATEDILTVCVCVCRAFPVSPTLSASTPPFLISCFVYPLHEVMTAHSEPVSLL